MWKNDKDTRSFGNSDRKRRFGDDSRSSFGGRDDSSAFRSSSSFGGGSRDRNGFGDSRNGRGFSKPEPRPQIVYMELLEGSSMPKYMTAESTGADITYGGKDAISIKEGEIATISTGLVLKFLPPRLEVQIRARSSLASKGLLILSPTSISSEHKNKEIKIDCINLGKEEITIKPGDRIAQATFSFVQRVALELHNDLEKTERGSGGFGSTNHTNHQED